MSVKPACLMRFSFGRRFDQAIWTIAGSDAAVLYTVQKRRQGGGGGGGRYGHTRRVGRILLGGGVWGWGCVWTVTTQTCRGVGGRGACSPGKILETLDCLGLHFARFHVGERECRVLEEKGNCQCLIS